VSQAHLNDNQLQDYLDGNIKAGDPAVIHLETCPQCQKALAVYRGLYSVIEKTPEPQLAPDFAEAVMQRLPQKYPVTAPAENGGFRIKDSLIMFIAAAVMIAAGIYFIRPDLWLKSFSGLTAPRIPQSQLLNDTTGFLSQINVSYLTIIFIVLTFAGIAIVDHIITRRRRHHKTISFLV
jgi:hypothetical protein